MRILATIEYATPAEDGWLDIQGRTEFIEPQQGEQLRQAITRACNELDAEPTPIVRNDTSEWVIDFIEPETVNIIIREAGLAGIFHTLPTYERSGELTIRMQQID